MPAAGAWPAPAPRLFPSPADRARRSPPPRRRPPLRWPEAAPHTTLGLSPLRNNSLDQFSDEDEVCASHIFKSVREAEKREEIFKGLCVVRQRLVDGADFTEVAKEHSDKPAEEIDLGYFKRGELMDEFEVVAFSMKTGEISPVFCTPLPRRSKPRHRPLRNRVARRRVGQEPSIAGEPPTESWLGQGLGLGAP